VTDLLSLGAPSYEELAVRQLRRASSDALLDEEVGAYALREQLPSGPDDECFVAIQRGVAGFVRPVFLRRFPAARLDEALIAAMKARAGILHRGVEQIYELGRDRAWGFIVSELIEGLGVDRLDDALQRRGERLPWPIALAMFHDACERITHLRDAGIVHGEVTPARLRLSLNGIIYLCHGVPGARPASWGRALCDVARPILRLAGTAEERALLDDLLGDADSEGALGVASDALVLRHPELDPVVPALLLSALEGAPLAMGRVTSMLLGRLEYLALHRMWELVVEVIAAARLLRSRPGR
jgi:hypothetical protein